MILDCQPKTIGFCVSTSNLGHLYGQHLEASGIHRDNLLL